jgi:hypothetical protein
VLTAAANPVLSVPEAAALLGCEEDRVRADAPLGTVFTTRNPGRLALPAAFTMGDAEEIVATVTFAPTTVVGKSSGAALIFIGLDDMVLSR